MMNSKVSKRDGCNGGCVMLHALQKCALGLKQ